MTGSPEEIRTDDAVDHELGRELLYRWTGLVDLTSGWCNCADGALFERAKAILYPNGDIAVDFRRRAKQAADT